MSSNDKKNEDVSTSGNSSRSLGALTYQVNNGNSYQQPVQPRPPRNMQDLLRYSTEVTANSGGVSDTTRAPLDDESKKFLEEALKSMNLTSMDIVEELKKRIEVLQKVHEVSESTEGATDCEEALDGIMDYVDNLDVANDFHKIGGFSILKPCLNSSCSSIRSKGAGLIAELCQNNPYCQEKMLEFKIMPTLLSMVDTDVNNVVKVKALYAVSCLIREYDQAISEFALCDGYSVLLRALQSEIGKLNIKAAFLISSLCSQKPEIKDELLKMGYVEQLIGEMAVFMQTESDERSQTSEHLLNALFNLIQDHEQSQEICRNPDYQFKEILNCIVEDSAGKDDRMEEFEYAQTLLKLVFKNEKCHPIEDR